MIRTDPLPTPKHRRLGRWADAVPDARCTDSSNKYDGGCIERACPKHMAEGYAEHMARHRNDDMSHVR